jgi:hypothetical protein
MVGKFGPSEVFTITKEEGAKNTYQLDAIENSNNSGNEVETTINLLNIAGTF